MEQKLHQMETMVEIISLESCLEIYSYLMIFGKTTPAHLREVTKQSKATMFRNLARLSEADILDKEEVKSVDDKRYSTHYFITKNLVDVVKGLYTVKLGNYAEVKGKSQLVRQWLSLVESLPYMLHQYTSKLMIFGIQSEPSLRDTTCDVVSKFLSFRLIDIDDVGTLHKKLQSIVEFIDQNQTGGKRDWKKPLTHPVAISFSVVALNPRGLKSETGSIVSVREC